MMSRSTKESSRDDEILTELQKISKALEKPEPTPPVPPKNFLDEFKLFLSKYKVMGLAVAFIMGIYLGGLVNSLVSSLLMPLIGLGLSGLGMGNLSTFVVTILSQEFKVGEFLVSLITFIFVSLVIFLLVKITAKFGVE